MVKIELKKVVITKRRILVTDKDTVFVKVNNLELIDIDGLVKLRSDLINKIKDLDGLVVKTNSGILKTLRTLKDAYIQDVKDYRVLFKELVSGWTEKVEEGIYVGYSSDETLKRLAKLKWQLNPYRYRSSTISKVENINAKLLDMQDLVNEYKHEQGCSMVVYL